MKTKKRECPHCHGSLERYEDPKAVEIIGKLQSELNTVLKIFRHVHVNNGEDDACKKCGLDLWHEIHERIAAQPNARDQLPRTPDHETTNDFKE
jgi:uncharacterized protein with PIN domain